MNKNFKKIGMIEEVKITNKQIFIKTMVEDEKIINDIKNNFKIGFSVFIDVNEK